MGRDGVYRVQVPDHVADDSLDDYVTELIGSQFAIVENPQAKGSGCGCGVSWEPIL